MNDFIKEECFKCGVVFAVSIKLQKSWKEHKLSFWCPNGHAQVYTKSTSEFLKEELEQKRIRVRELEYEVDKLNKRYKRKHALK